MAYLAKLSANNADQEVSGDMHEMDEWEPKRIHCDFYTKEPLDKNQQGRDHTLRAMQDRGVKMQISIVRSGGFSLPLKSGRNSERTPTHTTSQERDSNPDSCSIAYQRPWRT